MGKPDKKDPVCGVCGGHGTITHWGVTKRCSACNGKGK
jgi:DnaJ-class molecular chaperone